MTKNKFDVIIIGSGPAGFTAALRLAGFNKKVCLVERKLDHTGGVCLNEGCIPLKTALCGAEKNGSTPVPVLLKKAASASGQLRAALRARLENNLNITLVEGEGKITASNTVSVKCTTNEERVFIAGNIIIASGSKDLPPLFPGLPEKMLVYGSGIFKLKKGLKKVIIVGAGMIGCEFASLFSMLGIGVTLVEKKDRILPSEDEEAVRVLARSFELRKVKTFVSSEVREVSLTAGGKKIRAVIASRDSGVIREDADIILYAAGRRPDTDYLSSFPGIKRSKDGFIWVDRNYETSTSGIYACGDCINTPMLAQTAYAEAGKICDIIAGRKPEPVDYTSIPRAVFTNPPVARLGMTEKEAVLSGCEFKVIKRFFRANGMAAACGISEGFAKIIVSAESDKILGCHIVGGPAPELINIAALAKRAGLGFSALKESFFVHPSFSEIFNEGNVK